MFDIGWTEMVVIAVVAILVVGPRELPRMLRTIGQIVGKLKQMAGEFRRQFNDALKEAELDDIKTSIDSAKNALPKNPVKQGFDSLTKTGDEVKSAIETPSMANQKSPAPKPTGDTAATATAKASATGAAGTTAAAKSSTAKAAGTTSQSKAAAKPATSKPAASKATAPKAPASKPAAKKPAASKPAAKPAAAKPKKPASKPTRSSTAKTPTSDAKS